MRDVYWLRELGDLRLAIMPRPRAGEWLEEEIAVWRAEGLETVVSLLESSEVEELGLASEPTLCTAQGIQFFSFPIPDRGVPVTHRAIAPLVQTLASELRSKRAVGIHCRAGIGRSALVAASLMSAIGITPADAFAMLSRARGVAVPDTEAQTSWVNEFARLQRLGI
jgi:protein-tyrosine phosphatase